MNLIDRLVVSVVGDTAALKKSLVDSKKQLSGFGAAVQKHSATFMKTGAVMMGFAGAIGIAAIKVGKEFDKAYSKIRTGTGKTGKVLEGLKKDFRAVVKDVPNSFDEVSTAIADLNTRLGLTGKPLQDMAKQMLNLARITETDVNAVIRTSTRLFGDWGVEVEDQAETLNYLYKVSQSTGVGIDKLSDMVTTYGVQLRTVGFTLEESLALMGKWEKEGVAAEKMLGGLSMALGKFAKAQKEPEEAFRLLVQNIEEATTVGKAMELGVEALGTRAGPDFALAVREGRFAVEDFVKELDASLETINQAAEDTMTLTEKFNLLKNRAKLAIEPLAKKLMDDLMPALEKVTDKLGDLDEEQLDNIASSILFATKILAIGGAFIFTMGAVGKVTTAVKTLKTTYMGFDAYVKGSFFAGFLVKWGPLIGEVSTALGLMAMHIHDLERRWYGAGEALAKFKEETGGFWSYWSPIYHKVSDNIEKLADNIKGPLCDAYVTGQIPAGVFADTVMKLTTETGFYNEAIDLNIDLTEEEAKVLDSILQGTYKLTTATTAETVAKELGADATVEQIATTVDYENAIKGLMSQYGYTREQAEEYYKTTREGTGDINDQREALDKQREALDKLYDSLFDSYLLNADIARGLEEAEKRYGEYTEAVRIHGVGSDEANEKEEDWIRTVDMLASTKIPELINKVGLLTEEEVIHLKGMKDQISTAHDLGFVTDEEWTNISRSINEKIRESIIPDYQEMYRQGQIIDEQKIEPEITADTSQIDHALQNVLNQLKLIKDKKIKITTSYAYQTLGRAKGGPVGFAEGGITGSDGFSLPLLTAAKGLTIPSFDSGGILAMLDKYEVILNSPQQLNLAKLIFGLAEGKYGVKGGVGLNIEEMNITSPKPLTESEIKREIDMLSRELGYRMGL